MPQMNKTNFSVDQEPGRPRLYGRAKGRPLRGNQQSLMDNLYPEIKISEPSSASLQTGRDVWLELGFGGGEHLAWQAQANPSIDMWGAEPFLNGVAKALHEVDDRGLSNVRLFQGDGRIILDGLPDESLSKLFVLFPDPWPKKRHNKRRLISSRFLDDAYRVLKPGAAFRFASDIPDYVDWVMTRIARQGKFEWHPETHQDWRERPDDWPGTRYEAKAFREGRTCHYFEFIRR